MKKLLAIPLIAFFALPAFAGSNSASTTTTYDDPSVSAPMMGTDENSDMLEAQEEGFDQQRMEDAQWEDDTWEEQRMEDMSSEFDEDYINYQDRTRTDRARDALN